MDISKFQNVNLKRSRRWHKNGTVEWSLLEWAGAMAGESGEACNIAKKIKRFDTDLSNTENGLPIKDYMSLRDRLASEVADSIIYGLIILSNIDVDASSIIAKTFDDKSIEHGFPERAPK